MNDGAVMATASGEMLMSRTCPDVASNSSILNMGNYRTMGYQGSVAQKPLDEWTATLSLGAADAVSGRSRTEPDRDQSGARPIPTSPALGVGPRGWIYR